MMRNNTTTTVITSRMWIKPPKVCADTMPNSHRINSSIAMVSSIRFRLPMVQPPHSMGIGGHAVCTLAYAR
jgi:hypothetical protein